MPDYHVTSLGKPEEYPFPSGVRLEHSASVSSAISNPERDDSLTFDCATKVLRSGSRVTTAVDSVSFHVPKGQVVALLGPNGAGKTTLIKMLCGLILPDSGAIRIGGHAAGVQPHVRRRLGVSLEGSRDFYPLLTVGQNLHYFCSLMGLDGTRRTARIHDVLQQLGIAELENAPSGSMSRGQRQKLSLALCVAHDPDFVVLDEPTLGLDPLSVDRLCEFLVELRGQGKGVLLASHDLDAVERTASKVVLISRGQVRHQEASPTLANGVHLKGSGYLRDLYREHIGS